MMPTEPPVTRQHPSQRKERPLSIALKSWAAWRPFDDRAGSRPLSSGLVTKQYTDATAS
jgi:hypothetical protein